jgi:hypothetical protein
MHQVDADKMLSKIGNTKFNEWIAFYSIEAEDEEKAAKDAARR